MAIKRLRETKGLTQEALAKRARTHRVYIAQIESSARTPSLKMLSRIAKALGVPVGELLE